MYVIDFDIVAAILSSISLYLFFTRKRIADSRSRSFELLLWDVLGSSAFGVASSLAINALPAIPRWIVMLSTSLFYLFHNSIPMLVAMFLLSIGGKRGRFEKFRTAIKIPWMIAISIILANVAFPLVFFVDASGAYRNGPAILSLYALAFAYFAFILVAILRESAMPRDQRLAFLSALVLPLLAIVIQNIARGLMLECSAASLSALFILLTIQNSDESLDGETGLYNRDTFMRMIQEFCDQKRRFSLVAVHSKEIPGLQGLVGMPTYEFILRSYAAWLAKNAGKDSIVCALGEGLYAIILPMNPRSDSEGELAAAIAKRSTEVWAFDSLRVELPVRLGIFRCLGERTDVHGIMDLIEQLAKLPDQGGERNIFHTEDFMPNKERYEAMIALALKKRIEQRQLQLRYQPIFSVPEERIVALEALAGLTMADGEDVRQSTILKLAERLGLSSALAEIMLDGVFAWFIRNDAAGKGIGQVQIRFLESQCVESEWQLPIMRIAKARGMDLSRLCLEITETSVANAGENLAPGMALLAGEGVRFALDDYGSGYTDIGKILGLPFSIIKLDKGIVRSGLSNRKGEQLLAGSIALFKKLDYTVVAEGIETPEQGMLLGSMECDLLQGFHYGYPMDGDAVLGHIDLAARR